MDNLEFALYLTTHESSVVEPCSILLNTLTVEIIFKPFDSGAQKENIHKFV